MRGVRQAGHVQATEIKAWLALDYTESQLRQAGVCMRIVRTIAIWFFGLLAAGITGWGVGKMMGPYLEAGGLLAGLSAFICLRLWLLEIRAKSD